MIDRQLFEDITAKIGEVIENSPVKDAEKNIKAMLTATFSRMDLVTREEFEIQQQMLEHVCMELATLQQEMATLKNNLNHHTDTDTH